MILVDTSVWIDFFRGIKSWETARLVGALDTNEDLAICGPVLMEIRQGIASDKGVKDIQRRLSPLIYLATLRKTYCHAADIYRAARAKGKTIRNTIDCLIAACAIEHRAGLLQRDRDFATIARISNLEILLPDD
jgi:predicted nucleic acid-binding protein